MARSTRLLKGMMLGDVAVAVAIGTRVKVSMRCRDGGVGSTKRRQAVLTMSCEPALLLGRPYDLPGCAASADPLWHNIHVTAPAKNAQGETDSSGSSSGSKSGSHFPPRALQPSIRLGRKVPRLGRLTEAFDRTGHAGQ
jgi:hypothetical protein